MSPTNIPEHPWIIRRGDTNTFTFVWKDKDGNVKPLTGWTFKCQGRTTKDDPDTLFALTSSPAAGIVVTEAAGKVVCTLTPTQSALLDFYEGEFDIEGTRTSDGFVKTFVGGTLTLDRDATR